MTQPQGHCRLELAGFGVLEIAHLQAHSVLRLALPLNDGEVVLVPPICEFQLSRLLLCTRHHSVLTPKLCVCVRTLVCV